MSVFCYFSGQRSWDDDGFSADFDAVDRSHSQHFHSEDDEHYHDEDVVTKVTVPTATGDPGMLICSTCTLLLAICINY